MPEPAVPASPADITAEWLHAVVGVVFPVSAFATLEKQRIGADFGFASQIYRCRWQTGHGVQSVVVKLWDTASSSGSNEVRFYKTFPHPGIRVPACFYCAEVDANARGVLVLEDITPAVQGDVLEPLKIERAKAVTSSLAGLHAAWLDQSKLAALEWLPDISQWVLEEEWFRTRRKKFLDRFGGRLSELARRLLDGLMLAPKQTNWRLSGAQKTLLHGDFHLDNLLFNRNGQPVLLDWSRPWVGPLAVNLAALLFEMTSLEHFDAVLGHYLEAFNAQARTSLDRQTIEQQLGGAFLRKFAIGTIGIAHWQPSNSRGQRMIGAGIEALCETAAFWQKRDPKLFAFLQS